MDFFNADKLKNMAQSAGRGLESFGAQATNAAQKAAEAAKAAAERAAVEAKHAGQGMKHAANAMSAKQNSLVGQTVSIGGKPLYVETLLAEGGFGSVYTAVPMTADAAGQQAAAQNKVVLKRMYAGVSVCEVVDAGARCCGLYGNRAASVHARVHGRRALFHFVSSTPPLLNC